MQNDIVCHEIVRRPSYWSNIFSTQIFQELLLLRAAQHDELLLHKLQRHVQTTLDGSAGSWRRNTQAQALWTLATFIATGLSQGQTLQDVIEPLVAVFAY